MEDSDLYRMEYILVQLSKFFDRDGFIHDSLKSE
jgi:hypothetical protein